MDYTRHTRFPDPGPSPGSADYLKLLNEHVADAVPVHHFDDALFTALLFAIVSQKHLVLRTRAEDIHPVQKLTKSILTVIFGYATVVQKLRPQSTPADIVNGLFLFAGSAPATRKPHNNNNNNNRRQHSSQGRGGRPRTPSYTRPVPHIIDRAPHVFESEARPPSMTVTEEGLSTRGVRESGRDFPVLDHHDSLEFAQTNATSLADLRRPYLPHALVVAGLDYASAEAQQALWEIIRRRTVVIEEDQEDPHDGEIWNLPENFLIVSITSLGDGRARPQIIKPLLDRFGYTLNFFYQPDAIGNTHGQPQRKTPVLTRDYIEQLQGDAHRVAISNQLSLYITNITSAIRHHPQVDASLVTSRYTKDFMDLVKTSCALAGRDVDLLGKEQNLFSATDVDVRRVIRGVLGHRISIRRAPEDEVLGSLVMSSPQNTSRYPRDAERRTTKDVIDEILLEV